jgi:YbgC/YbaW family acyl-CoA thioester hydrolase
MAFEFRDRRRVEFYETDMAGIVHFSNFFRFMESAEHAFFRSLGLRLHQHQGEGMTGWARRRASCEYLAPLHYMDEVEIELRVRAKTRSTLSYDFVFRRLAPSEGSDAEEIARGSLQVVHVAREDGRGSMKASAMPAEVASAIEVAPLQSERTS